MALDVDVLAFGRERARTRLWAADGPERVALLAPLPDAPAPSAQFLRRCLDALRAQGFSDVVTGALGPSEQRPFLAAGFTEAERLHLLRHDLLRVPAPDPAAVARCTLRRARAADRPRVLAVDHDAFRPFWRLDEAGLQEAISATARARFTVACTPDGRVVGYLVTGRSGRRGYVQRLAVDPSCQGQGIGAVLLLDGLRWLRRWRVEHAVVNTQLDNTAALGLYERVGFRRLAEGLAVLRTGTGVAEQDPPPS